VAKVVTSLKTGAPLSGGGIDVQSIFLRDVLPQMLKASIEAKQQAEQKALQMTSGCRRKNRKHTASASRRKASATFSRR